MAKKKAEPARYPLERVRNIGIIAHIDAGKTTTTEQILYYSGTEHRLGAVDEGTTRTDYDPDEQKRGITIVSAAVTTHWTPAATAEHRINIIDTPGHIDFTAEVERALRVLDGAIGIFCGVAGVQAQSETVWRQAEHYGIPRIAYVNKLDRSGASFYDVLSDLEEHLEGMRPIALQVPIGEEKDFRGVVDLVTMRAWEWDDGSPPPPPREVDIPEATREMAQLYRDQLVERLAEIDEEVEARFLEEAELTPELLRTAVRRATLGTKAYPVLCGASFRNKGVQPLLDAICYYLPSPTDRPPIVGRRPKGKLKKATEDRESWLEEERPPELDAPFAALAFKTVSSKTADVVYLRVYSGRADKTSQLLNVGRNKKERLGGGIYRLHANRRVPLEETSVGEIVGVVGLRYTTTGDTLSDPQHPIVLGRISFPIPVVAMAVEPRSTKDRDELQEALERLAKDDPTFAVRQDEETGQTVISGMGELHLEVIAERLRRDWNIEAKIGKPRVSYKATVTERAEGTGVYDMEVGDKRVYGEVRLGVEPEKGAPGGLLVDFDVPEEEIPEDLHEAVEDGVRSKAIGVGDWGDPLIDVRIRVTGGRYDPETAAESAYRAAASRALDEALQRAGLASLEPVMTLSVDAPEDFFGSLMQDLQGRRAEVLHTQVLKDRHRVTAAVPLAEVFGYATDIRSKTQGRAEFTLEPRDYAVVPAGKRPKLF